MRLFDQNVLINHKPYNLMLDDILHAGRNCYNSYDKITEGSALKLIKNFIKRGHMSPLLFADMTFTITTSRAIMAEITRHRVASFCVRSQRYCCLDDPTGGLSLIRPLWYGDNPQADKCWLSAMKCSEQYYQLLKMLGMKNEQARLVLPNSCMTRIVMKANIREWRHFFLLRCSAAAHPQMRNLAKLMLKQAYEHAPVFFLDQFEQFILGRTSE